MFNDEAQHTSMTDKNGTPWPGKGWVKGPQGYWQTQIGAETELLHGPEAQFSQSAIPGNTPGCAKVCTALSTVNAYRSGTDTTGALEEISAAYQGHPNPGVDAARHIIRQVVIPMKVYNTAVQVETIQNECNRICQMDATDYQFRNH